MIAEWIRRPGRMRSTDSATTARAPPGPASRATVASRCRNRTAGSRTARSYKVGKSSGNTHESAIRHAQANIKPPHQTRCVTEALARLERVFVETPGVRLTAAAAAQKAGLDRQVCRIRLLRLTETGFLEQRLRGVFGVRRSEAPLP